MVLVEGSVTEMGSYQELLDQNGAFAEFLRNYSLEDIEEEENDDAAGRASCYTPILPHISRLVLFSMVEIHC